VREKKDIRLFFALWPDETLRDQLHRASNTLTVERPARRVPHYNLHMTLHFIGNVFVKQMDCLRQQAHLVKAEAFELSIDRQGHFSKPRVAWLGCREIPTALRELHEQLGQRLQLCDYQPEARRYNPHVTVARKIGAVADSGNFAPIAWKVDEFSLVEVRQIEKGVQYRVIETFPLL
jgi:2'-5' RNA ligase